MDDFKMTNLKNLRKKRHITQVKLSVEIGVFQELISHYEIGNSKPNIDTLIKLADYFQCSTDYLLNRSDVPNIPKPTDKNYSELNDLLEKYKSLSTDQKQAFNSYLDFLCKN